MLGEESMPFSPGKLLHNAQNSKLNFFYNQIFHFIATFVSYFILRCRNDSNYEHSQISLNYP